VKFELTEAFLDGCRWYADILAKQVQDEVETLGTESPIEAMLLAALVFHAHQLNLNFNFVDPGTEPSAAPHLYIATQRKIAGYRVDIIIGNNTTNTHFVVECDGANFHHATREQIERDRKRDAAIEALGFTVIRYPGKQIYAEPFYVAGTIWTDIAPDEHQTWIRSIAKYLK
jgi:very-short-patch-repair endonuclease